MLKVRLEQWGCTVVAQILEQDEQGVDNQIDYFVASNGYQIISANYPQIGKSDHALYIRGRFKKSDNDVVSAIFETEHEAAHYIDSINVAIDEFNKQGGFETKLRGFFFTIGCKSSYKANMKVPSHLTEDEAIQYVNEHISKISLGTLIGLEDIKAISGEFSD